MGNFNRNDRSQGGRGGGFGRDRGTRTLFKAVCSNCGKDCEVPFRPTNGKPVYCSDCFQEKMGRNENRTPRGSDHSKSQLDEINSKLNRILNILQPKQEVVAPKIEEKTESVDESVAETPNTETPESKEEATKKVTKTAKASKKKKSVK